MFYYINLQINNVYGLAVGPHVFPVIPKDFTLDFLTLITNPLCFHVFPCILEGRIMHVDIPLHAVLTRGESVQHDLRN
jgi:hypothetical protein